MLRRIASGEMELGFTAGILVSLTAVSVVALSFGGRWALAKARVRYAVRCLSNLYWYSDTALRALGQALRGGTTRGAGLSEAHGGSSPLRALPPWGF